jgi:drug/metabolite transporter (DMT)-like permease
MAMAASLVMLADVRISPTGVLLAVLSGAITSGMGYAIWYSVLPALSATRAATVQLAAPVLAAIGGVMLLAEPITLRLVVSTILILGGVGLTVAVKERLRRQSDAGSASGPTRAA